MPISRPSVGLSELAAESLRHIEGWYRQPGSGAAAARRIQAIVAAIARLADYPYAGRAGHVPGTRELTCRSHRIVYELKIDDTSGDIVAIIVLDVYGPGQP